MGAGDGDDDIPDIKTTVYKTIAKKLHIDPDDITDESSFDDLGISSSDTVKLVIELEDLCGIEMSDEGAEAVSTVREVITYLRKLDSKREY